jgi:hypothetical protein
VTALIAVLAGLYVVVLLSPPVRRYFALAPFDPVLIVISVFGAILAVIGLWFTDDRFVPEHFRETLATSARRGAR